MSEPRAALAGLGGQSRSQGPHGAMPCQAPHSHGFSTHSLCWGIRGRKVVKLSFAPNVDIMPEKPHSSDRPLAGRGPDPWAWLLLSQYSWDVSDDFSAAHLSQEELVTGSDPPGPANGPVQRVAAPCGSCRMGVTVGFLKLTRWDTCPGGGRGHWRVRDGRDNATSAARATGLGSSLECDHQLCEFGPVTVSQPRFPFLSS